MRRYLSLDATARIADRAMAAACPKPSFVSLPGFEKQHANGETRQWLPSTGLAKVESPVN